MFGRIRDRLRRWYGPVAGSIRRTVNAEELKRCAVAALGAGATGAGLSDVIDNVLAAVVQDAPAIFRGPVAGAVLSAAVVFVREYLRRRAHGCSTPD